MSRRGALEVLKARLQEISQGRGYRTEIGQLVLDGEVPVLNDDDPWMALSLVVQPERVGHQAENVVTTIPVEVHVNVKLGTADPRATMEDALEDVKKAVESDHDLAGNLIRRGLERGPARILSREEGSNTVGLAQEYSLTYSESWGLR